MGQAEKQVELAIRSASDVNPPETIAFSRSIDFCNSIFLAKIVRDPVRSFMRTQVSADVLGGFSLTHRLENRGFDSLRLTRHPNVVQHHCSREDSPERVCDIFPRNLRC